MTAQTILWFLWMSATALLTLLSVAPAARAEAQVTLMQSCVSATGGAMSGASMSASSIAGEPAGGVGTTPALSVTAGYTLAVIPLAPGSRTIAVSGTINEPVASVTVNGLPATITGNTFAIGSVPIVEGANTILAQATDLAGNIGMHSITVYLDTHPPAMPTVATPLVVLTSSSHQLCGTKLANTTIWINGVEVIDQYDPYYSQTSWCANVSNLLEGDNILSVVAKDAAGNASATASANLLVDNLPPVISNVGYFDVQGVPLNLDPGTQAPKTNFTPVTVTGQVDDMLTVITIDGQPDTQTGSGFTIVVPLALGSNTLAATATSPNGYVTNQSLPVLMGSMPAAPSVLPGDGSKSYADTTVTLQGVSSDPDNDPLEFQFSVDGQVLQPWSSATSASWAPTLSQLGIRPITVEVRDNFGGTPSQDAETYVVHQPVAPPQ